MSVSLEDRVAALEAAAQIRSLKSDYAKACDTGFPLDVMRELFTADAVWTDITGTFGTHNGIDAICEFFTGAATQIPWALHYIVAPDIQVAPDLQTATGSWYLWQPCTIEGTPTLLGGTYADEYALVDGRWRISRIALDLQLLVPHESGWAAAQIQKG
jgi:hypothetical protein